MGLQILPLTPADATGALTAAETALRDTVCQALNIPLKAWPIIIANTGRENLRTLSHNGGRWTVSIKDGSAHVEPGGDGSLRMDIKGLAPLYTGMMSPAELQRVGWVDGDAVSIMQAEQVFRGATPWIVEMF